MKNKTPQRKSSAPDKRENNYLFLFLLIIIPLLLYIKSVSYDFSGLDDTTIIKDNFETLKSLSNLPVAFTTDAFLNDSGGAVYRPLQTVVYMLDAAVAGQNAWIYHLSNLLIHLLTVITLYFFLKKIGINDEISFILSLIFAVHPLFTQAVCWIPSCGDLLLTLFTLLSFITYLRYFSDQKLITLLLHSAAFFLALLSKETAILLPFLIVAYLFFVIRKRPEQKTVLLTLASWILPFFIYIYLRQVLAGIESSSGNFGLTAFLQNLAVIPITFGKFFIPYNLNTMPLFDNISIAIGLIVLILFVLIVLKIKQKETSKILLGLTWFIIFTIPPMLISTKITEIGFNYFEHRTYLPMIGVILIFGFLLNKTLDRISVKKIYNTAIPIIVVFAFISFTHSQVFADPVLFFNSAITTNNGNAVAYNSLGNYYYKQGNIKEAYVNFKNAIQICSTYSTPYIFSGLIRSSKGNYTEAERYFSLGIKYDTLNTGISIGTAKAISNLAITKIKLKKYDDAISLFEKAAYIDRKNDQIHYMLGTAYSITEDYAGAIKEYKIAISLNNLNPEYFNSLASVEYTSGKYDEALINSGRAIELNPAFIQALIIKGKTEIALTNFDNAIRDFSKTIQLDPRNGTAYYYRGIAYSKKQMKQEAMKDWEQAYKLGFKQAMKLLNK